MPRKTTFGSMLKQTGIYGVPVLVRRLSAIALIPLFTRRLSTAEYGIIELVDLSLFLATLLFGLKLGDALLYSYANADTSEQKAGVVGSALVAAGAFGLLAGVSVVSLAGPLAGLVLGGVENSGFLRLAAANLVFLFPLEVGLSWLRASGRSIAYGWVSAVRILLQIALVLLLMLGFDWRVEAFLWANIVTSAIVSAYLVGAAVRQDGFLVSVPQLTFQVRYGAPLAVHGLAMLFVHYGDRFFLQSAGGLSAVGIYALSYKVGMTVSYVQSPFDMYWRAQAFHILKEEEGRTLYARTFTYYISCLALVAVTVAAFSSALIKVMAGHEFQAAAQYVPWLALAYLLRAAADFFRTVMRTEAKTTLEAVVTTISALICLGAYAALIPRFGISGAAGATVLGFACMAMLSYWAAQRLVAIQFEHARLLKLSVLVVFAIALSCTPVKHLGAQLALGAAVLLAFASGLWRWVFDATERTVVLSAWKSRLRAMGLAPGTA